MPSLSKCCGAEVEKYVGKNERRTYCNNCHMRCDLAPCAFHLAGTNGNEPNSLCCTKSDQACDAKHVAVRSRITTMVSLPKLQMTREIAEKIALDPGGAISIPNPPFDPIAFAEWVKNRKQEKIKEAEALQNYPAATAAWSISIVCYDDILSYLASRGITPKE